MSLTISTKTYSLDSNPTPDSAKFTGPAQTATVKDVIILKRQAPKVTKDFPGTVRCSEKTVKTVVVNLIPRDMIAETTYSYVVGTPQADITALRVDHAALATNACTQTLVDNAKLVY